MQASTAMSVRISGLLLKRFFRDESAWPAGQRFQAAEFMVEGTHVPDPLSIADGALVEVRGGLTFLSARDQAGPSLEIRLALWLADAATATANRAASAA